MRKLLSIVAAFAIFAAIYLMLKPAAPSADAGAPKSAAADARELPASSVLRINPRSMTAPAAPSPAKAAPVATPDIAQLRSRKGWADLQARVASGPQTPEALYIQAEIYSRCAKRPPAPNAPPAQAEARDKFIAGLKGDKNSEQRIAAYEKTKVDPCEGLALGEFSGERLAQMLDVAASAGDPRAQAWRLAQSIEREFFDTQARPSGYAVSDQQMESIRRLLAFGDSGVLVDLQGILSSTLRDANLRMGPDNERVDSSAMASALTLVACDLGASCGADSQRLLMQCAMQGYCAASNLYDHTYFYDSPPYQAQLMEQYRRALLQMVNDRDFSGLRLVREPTTPGMSSIRSGRRGP